MSKWLLFSAALLVSLSAQAARDPEDAEGASDHPEVPRFPGYYLADSEQNDFNTYEFQTGKPSDDNGDFPKVVKEGRFWQLGYYRKEKTKPASAVELVRNYENAFKKAGGSAVYKCTADDCSWYGAVYRQALGKGERWVRVEIYNSGDNYQLVVVDVAKMEQKVEVTANEMAEALAKDGFVALRGILFDTGKAQIKPESEPLLAEIVALFKSDRALRLSVEGHTDNVGERKANLALSKARAESVVAWLAGKGVDRKRLKADGKGDTVPVADNRTESGRAQNRRVELVKF